MKQPEKLGSGAMSNAVQINATFWLGVDGDFDVRLAKLDNLMRYALIDKILGQIPFTPHYCRPIWSNVMRIVGHLNPELDESKLGVSVITLDHPMTAAEALAMEETRPLGWRLVFRHRNPSANDSDVSAPLNPETDAAEINR